MNILRNLFIVCALSWITIPSEAQRFTEVLDEAQDAYDAGHLYGIPSMLNEVINNGTREERIRAFRLLTSTYMLIDDPFSAENSYLRLLNLDPEFVPDAEVDGQEIVFLAEKFTTSPIFTFRVARAGLNFANIQVINSYNPGSGNESSTALPGLSIGTGVELNFTREISLGAELGGSLRRFKIENNFLTDIDPTNSEQTQLNLDLPVYAKYTFYDLKYKPFIYLGHSYHWGVNATMDNLLLNNELSDGENIETAPVEGPVVNGNPLRTFINRSALLGIGGKYKVGYRFLTVDFRFILGLTNQSRIENQYDNEIPEVSEVLYNYGIVDNDFWLNGVEINFAYEWPAYKPRKKQNKKGIMGKILANQK